MLFSNFLYGLLVLTFICIGVLIIVMTRFGIKYYWIHKKLREYTEFVRESYIQRGIDVPVMIQRIQSEYISDYNKLAENWIGIRFRIKKRYPEIRENGQV